MHPRLSLYNPPRRAFVSWFEMVDTASSLGLNFLEGFSCFEFSEPDEAFAKKLRAYADEKGVRFSCLSVFADLLCEEKAEHVRRMKEYAKVAQILGSPFLHHTVAPRFSLKAKSAGEIDRAFETAVCGVREVFDFAKEVGVKTVYENQAYLINGVERYGRFLKEVERDVGVVADFGNVFQADERITPFLERFAPRVVHVHLKDMITVSTPENSLVTASGAFVQECDPGEGEVDFKSALARLAEVGYGGVYSIERHAYHKDVEIKSLAERVSEWL